MRRKVAPKVWGPIEPSAGPGTHTVHGYAALNGVPAWAGGPIWKLGPGQHNSVLAAQNAKRRKP